MKKEIVALKNKNYDEEVEKINKKINYQKDYFLRNLCIASVEENPVEH